MGRSSRSRARDLAAISALLLLGGWPLAVHGQPVQGVELRWDAPRDCAASPQVLVEARRLLGPDFRHGGRLEVRLEIRPRDGGGYRLQLEAEGERAGGARRLELASCGEVRDAAALLIALILDPQLEVEPPPSEPGQPALQQPGPAAAETPRAGAARGADADADAADVDEDADALDAAEVSEPASEPPPARSGAGPGLRIGVPSLGMDGALLPGFTPSLGGWLGVRWGALELHLGGLYLLPRTQRVLGTPDYGVDVDALAGRLRACFELARPSGVGVGPCAGVLLGRIAAAPDVAGGASGSALLLAPELAGALDLELNKLFSLNFYLGARFPQRRPSFVAPAAGEQVTVYRPPAAALLAEISLVIRP